MFAPIRQFGPKSLAVRLYALLGFAVVSVVALSAAGMHFAGVSGRAAMHLADDGIKGVSTAASLEVLIEKHRRIVEAAPADLDQADIRRGQVALTEIEDHVRKLIAGAPSEHRGRIAGHLPELAVKAERVLFFALNFAQDKAQDAVNDYQGVATGVQKSVVAMRMAQTEQAGMMARRLIDSADWLTRWAGIAGFVAMVVLAPLGLLVLGDAARRLHGLWGTMRRLSANDTTSAVPSLDDADEIGDVARAVQVFKDNAIALTQTKRDIEQLNGWLDIALNNMARGLSMFDGEQRLMLCNDSYRTLYAVPAECCLRGVPVGRILAARDCTIERIETTAGERITTEQLIASRAPISALQYMSDGRIIEIAVQPLAMGGWVAVHEDVTRQHVADKRIVYLARHDTLTGLANRFAFREELAARCEAADGAPKLALLVLDLDHFKEVNDTLGHPAGDALLEVVARRLGNLVRARDLVARLGGDEFAILQADVRGIEDAEALAARIIDALKAPYAIAGKMVQIGVSVGIALAGRDGREASQLFSHADLALYQSKARGRGVFSHFDSALKARLDAERSLDADLQGALAAGQMLLHYQPIVDLERGEIACCEALLRWEHPVRGMVSPMDFVPLAEASGLIVPIGTFVLQAACAAATRWPDHVKVAVNLSAAQFIAGDLVETVAGALAASGLAARRLELEVTESLLLADRTETHDIIVRLRALGVSIALDDFGTGYSSLSYLLRFPFDTLKIDRSFVRDLPAQAESAAIVRAMATLASSLGMASVAEGVETVEHLAHVREAGCRLAQGYLFSRPVKEADVPVAMAACARQLMAKAA